VGIESGQVNRDIWIICLLEILLSIVDCRPERLLIEMVWTRIIIVAFYSDMSNVMRIS